MYDYTSPIQNNAGIAYLHDERKRPVDAEKREFLDGKIIAMPGASKNHVRICRNVTSQLWLYGSDKGFEVYQSDLRVHNPMTNSYCYPDIVVSQAHQEEYVDGMLDTLLNPILIIEVLSDTTEAYDRGQKFNAYRSIPSLQEYVLITQDMYQVEIFYRNTTDEWVIGEVIGGQNAFLTLNSLATGEHTCQLSLQKIYQSIIIDPIPQRN